MGNENLTERIAKLSPAKRALLELRLKERNGNDFVAQTIPRRPSKEPPPLSFAQQRLWFLNQLEPQSPAYNESRATRFSGALNVAALESALNRIVERHEVLRTTFEAVDGRPMQIIAQHRTIELPLIDLRKSTAPTREAEVHRLIAEMSRRPFDLSRDLMLRAVLLRLDDQEHILSLTTHHIASDGWSGGVLTRELAALYGSFISGQPARLPDLPVQYADYALWQRDWLRGEILDTQIAYWKKQLDGILRLQLPADHPRPSIRTFQGPRESSILSERLSDQLRALSRREGVTLYMTLLAAFQVLLYRYTGEDEVVVGSPIAGRTRVETENLIGFFVNTLVMRTNLSGNPSFRELLGRVREVALGAYAHQDLPFERLVEELNPDRNLSGSALFQVMFALQNVPRWDIDLPGVSATPVEMKSGIAKFDLFLAIIEQNRGLTARAVYNSDLFEASTIARMLDHFEVLLQAIVADPGQRISELPIMTEAEKHQIVVEWNQTKADFPQKKCIQELFEDQVKKSPDAVAVVFEEQQLTYDELNRQANRLAHYLRRHGVGPKTLVGILMERSIEMMIGLLGILKAGGAYLPLDPQYPLERLAFMLKDAQASLVLTQERIFEDRRWSIEDGDPRSSILDPRIKVVCLDRDWGDISKESDENVYSAARPDNVAYVMYTSGSTGKPKGVEVLHRGINRLLFGIDYVQLDSQQTLLQLAPISFDASTFEIWGALLHGGKCVLYPGRVPAPAELRKLLHKHEVSTLWLTASLFNAVVDEEPEILSTLRQLLIGGEALSTPHVRRALEVLPQTSIINGYGPTESTTFACCYRIPRRLDDELDSIPIGHPIGNTAVYILDRHLSLTPIGVPGELYIGGDGLSRGYLKQPQLTAEKFIPNPFSDQPGSRLYKTGDRARYLPDGNIQFLGRLDDQVKIRGFRIEPGEIESVLMQHPGVKEAVVLAQEKMAPDSTGSVGSAALSAVGTNRRLVAYVTSTQEPPPSAHELRGFLKQRLPEYMIPAAFLSLKALPITPNGKLDRSKLPDPDTARREVQESFIAPRSPVEEILAQIWRDVLKLNEVGIHDNFFDLGGHSLLATQVVSRIRATLLVDLPLRNAFESPTIAGLARDVDIARGKLFQLAPIRPVSRTLDLPLSFAQQRLWFLDQLEPHSSVYNVPSAWRLRGALDIRALQQSINEIVKRHETLRTNFSVGKGKPVQTISAPRDLTFPVIDLTGVSEGAREDELRRLGNEEVQQPFDLAHGPLLRAKVLRLSDQDHVLLLAMHHIVSDGWSMGILFRELSSLYRSFSRKKEPFLSELPVQYADYAVWQRDRLQGELLQSQIAYWKTQLEDVSALRLPADRRRPEVKSYRGASLQLALPQDLYKRLNAWSRKQNGTLFITLLAAFYTLLHRYTGQEDIAVGSPIANRNRAEIENLIGFFVNTLVLRIGFSAGLTFTELWKHVREVALEAYAHQELPFEKLVEELQPERSLSSSPLFQVMFVLQNAPSTALELGGLSVTAVKFDNPTAKSDLILSMREEGQELRGTLQYSTDLYDVATMDRMLGHYRTLLETIVADPEQRISELPIMTEAEKHQIVVEWNQTKADFPQKKCIQELFEDQVKKSPDAVAVVFEEQQLTYDELNRQANRLAHYLRRHGVGPKTLVGILMERSIEMMIGLLGILKAGGAYLPLDPQYPLERLAFMLKDAQASLVLTQERIFEDRRWSIEDGDPRSSILDPRIKVVCLDRDWGDISKESDENVYSAARPDNVAYVMYTSGSTGKPKGVEVLHRGINRLLFGIDYVQLDSQQTLLQLAPISFDASTFEIWGALLHGGKCVLYPGRVPAPAELRKLLHKHEVSTLWLTASLFNAVVDEEPEILSTLRQLLIGGEALSTPHVRRALEVLPQTSIINGYGPTESTTFACCYRIPRRLDDELDSIPIGHPIGNTAVYILDRHLSLTPIGVPGELYIGGDGLSRGYLKQPQLTAEKFIPNPFSDQPGSRLYKTGDRARYLPDGNIQFLGRLDDQVKIRGFRIEPGEIESVLMQHPGVKEAVVLAQEKMAPDSTGSVGSAALSAVGTNRRLVAYVTSTQEPPPSAHELRGFLKQRLPEYMIPAAFLSLKALPITPNGKLDRAKLANSDLSFAAEQDGYAAPRSELEQILAALWAEVLGVERVGIHDNFFDRGGHSLLAVVLVSRIEKRTGKNIPLSTVFRAPTVAQLARFLKQEKWSPFSSSLIPVQDSGSKQPFFCVHGAWGSVLFCADLARQMGPDQPFYGLQAPGFDGEQDPLTEVEAMAAHYIEALREVQSEGPYMLGGLSMGGLVAFEMAQQLRLQGQNVSLLILIDTPRPIWSGNAANESGSARGNDGFFNRLVDRLQLASDARHFARYARDFFQLGLAEQWNQIRKKTTSLGAKITYNRQLGSQPIETADLRNVYPIKIREANLQAIRRYKPSFYPGSMTLFVPSDSFVRSSMNSRMAWRELAGGGLEICEVPGDHNTMIKEPHSKILAETLRDCIQKAQASNGWRCVEK